VNTAGSYSYNTNNNMTGTKKLDAYRTISGTNYKIAYRAQWTFAFDRKNRLKTHTYAGGSNVRGNIWYDGMGRIWQRWNDNSSTGDWDADLKRFVYDGSAMAQEHEFVAMEVEGAWSYAYGQLNTDYLRKPDGIRQKVNNGVGGYDSHLLFNDGADVASRTPSGSSTTITRTLRTASGDRLNDNPRMTAGLTSGSFSNISNLAKPNSYIESYGGGTELGTSSLGYDSLRFETGWHFLASLGGLTGRLGAYRFSSGNAAQILPPDALPIFGASGNDKLVFSPAGNGKPPREVSGAESSSYPEDWPRWKFYLYTCLFEPLIYAGGMVSVSVGGVIGIGMPWGLGDYPNPPEPSEPPTPPEQSMSMYIECCCYEEFERWRTDNNYSYIDGYDTVQVDGCSCNYVCRVNHKEMHIHTDWRVACPEGSFAPVGSEYSICCEYYISDYWEIAVSASVFSLSTSGYSIHGEPCDDVCHSALHNTFKYGTWAADMVVAKCKGKEKKTKGRQWSPCPPKGQMFKY